MNHKVFGKKIETTWSVKENSKKVTDDNGWHWEFTDRPELVKETTKTEWDIICEYDSLESRPFNCEYYTGRQFNISEHDEVSVCKEIFRADLGEMFIYTDHVISEEHTNKEGAEAKYDKLIEKFNAHMIENDEAMKSHCELYNLKPAKTDVVKLWKEVHNCDYNIVDGKMTDRYAISCDMASTLRNVSESYTINNGFTIKY